MEIQSIIEHLGNRLDGKLHQFYLLFPNWNAVRSNLNWTHYRLLVRVESEKLIL